MPPGAGAHIGLQEHAGVLHDARLLLQLIEELLAIAQAVAQDHWAQEQDSEDQTWGKRRGCHLTGEEAM